MDLVRNFARVSVPFPGYLTRSAVDIHGYARFLAGLELLTLLLWSFTVEARFFLYGFRLYYCGHIHCWSALDWPMWLDVGSNLLFLL